MKESILRDDEILDSINRAADELIAAYRKGGRVYIAGNGGSAADAQHFAAELVGRFQMERSGYFAVALTTDSSALTAISNDYGFESIFSRQLDALGAHGDVFIGITTSGNSPNVLKAFEVAREKGMSAIALTGAGGGVSSELADIPIVIPDEVTARVQECHILVIHILCEIVENTIGNPD